MTRPQFQQFRRTENIIEEVCVRTASTDAGNGNSLCHVRLEDIRELFPDAQRFKLDGQSIPFLVHSTGHRIEPPCIAFYPNKVLDVITEIPQSSCQNNSAVRSPTSRWSENSTLQDSSLQSSDSSHIAHNVAQIDMDDPGFEQIKELLLQVKEKDNEMLKLQSEMAKLQLKAEENDRMLKLQLEVLKLQLEAKQKDDEMLKLRLEAKEKDEMIIGLQQQAFNRLAILQKHVNTILFQTFELQNSLFPRLFILLPVEHIKWDLTNTLKNRVRLQFLCECDDHIVTPSKGSQNQIHIVQHDGYEIRNSTEFFRKYGKHMLVLLEWLKLRILSSASLASVPRLANAKIDYSLQYMKALSIEYPSLSDINIAEGYRGLEGPDLQQLGTFLQINNEDKQLGNLYRITTETGHVKWICVDHYRSTFKEKEQEVFANSIKVYNGKYDPNLDKATIILRSRAGAEDFFSTLRNVRCVHELDITFSWDWTEIELEAFGNALKASSVSTLRLELDQCQDSNNRKAFSTPTYYRIILTRIIGLNNLKRIHIVLSQDLLQLSILQPKRLPHLQKFSFEIRPRGIGASYFQVLVESLKVFTVLTILDLGWNSIGNEQSLALAEALKDNTTLTTLNLTWNSIGKGGALALSEALKTNTTLTALNLSCNSVGKEGALALSKVLKVNTTLTTLNLSWNSIGVEGVLALSEALKVNTTLSTLGLERNSIGDGGALELSEALKINTALTTLDLNRNSIRKAGALALSEALKVNVTLTILDLSWNSIGDEGALALSEALKSNTTLVSLDLWLNSIGNEGAIALSKALKSNITLRYLSLRENSVGNEGSLALSWALKTNTALSVLDLDWNSIGDEGALALAEALKLNTTLTTLKLHRNSIGNEGALALSEALKVNATLGTLGLERNPIRMEGALALAEALKFSPTLTTLKLGDNTPISVDKGAQAKYRFGPSLSIIRGALCLVWAHIVWSCVEWLREIYVVYYK